MPVVEYLDETLERTKDNWGSARVLSYEGVTPPPKPGTPNREVFQRVFGEAANGS
jgi:hypothetical protein